MVTGSGGYHLYFRFPEGTPDTYANPDAHVDFRGEKGYAMLPGSTHPNGNEVYWDLGPDETPVAVADENVIAFVEHYRPESAASDSSDADDFDGKRFVLPDELYKGERDETLCKWACSERAKNTSYAVTIAALQANNANHCHPPLSEAIVRQKVDSAYKHPAGTSYGQKAAEVLTHEGSGNGPAFGVPGSLFSGVERVSRNEKEWFRVFARWLQGKVCFVPEEKGWRSWDGKHWVKDGDGQRVNRLCKQFVDELMVYAQTSTEIAEESRESFVKFVNKYNKLNELNERK